LIIYFYKDEIRDGFNSEIEKLASFFDSKFFRVTVSEASLINITWEQFEFKAFANCFDPSNSKQLKTGSPKFRSNWETWKALSIDSDWIEELTVLITAIDFLCEGVCFVSNKSLSNPEAHLDY